MYYTRVPMIDISEKPLRTDALHGYRTVGSRDVFALLGEQLKFLRKKIVVLDDDPTGVQTVHGVPVFTSWETDTVAQAFREDGSMFFILTNSRGMTSEQTKSVHTELAKNLYEAAGREGKEFILVSRSDSTLRGHYPLETMALKTALEDLGYPGFDGEIIFPFFLEGGRFTIGSTHFVREGEQLLPAAQTEFAKDKSFGYSHSFLPNWCEEKTGGVFKAEDVVCVSIEDLRGQQVGKIAAQLEGVFGFGKVVVDSISYEDVAVFMLAFIQALNAGKNFMFRSAAAVTKVLGGISDKSLLTREELSASGTHNGGIVLVGSHVNKTTRQLQALLESGLPLAGIEFDVRTALEDGGLEQEAGRITEEAGALIGSGKTVVVFTSRERLDAGIFDEDEQVLLISRISDAVTSIVSGLEARPAFIVAKGGITSSDVGTKALRVRRATVLGQAAPGVPVWLTGPESKFPGMPYIIFPGNVGDADTLLGIVSMLEEGREYNACV